MSFAVRLVPDELRSLSFAGIGGVFVPVGGPFAHPMRIISIKNLTNQNLTFSFDGINPHDVVPAEAGVVYDFCTNRITNDGAFIAAGTQIFVEDNGVAPTSGAVFITCFYGFGD